MVLVSVQSVEDDNGYSFSNTFAESLIIDPNSKVSLISIQFSRKVSFLVLASGNAFEIKVGDTTVDKDIITIPPGSYTIHTLAQAIQSSLNNAYHPAGHTFSVTIDSTNNKLSISNTFVPVSLPLTKALDWDTTLPITPYTVRSAQLIHFGPMVKTANEGPWTGIVTGDSNFIQTTTKLETTYVNTVQHGGSSVEFSINFTDAQFPPTPTVQQTLGFVCALAETQAGNTISQAATQVSTARAYMKSAMVFYRTQDGNPHLKIVELGVDIGADVKFAPMTGDKYRIMLAVDSKFPIYQYKRKDMTSWVSWDLTDGNQSFSSWQSMDLQPILGGDCAQTNDGFGYPTFSANVSAKGSAEITPILLVPTSKDDTHTYRPDHAVKTEGTIQRVVVGAYEDYNVRDGLMSQLLSSDKYADFEFNMTNVSGDFFVSIVDENRRLLTAAAQDAISGSNNTGTDIQGGLPFGRTADYDGTANADNNFNPAVYCYRFNGWDQNPPPPKSPYVTKKIYKRSSFNQRGPDLDSDPAGRRIPVFEEVGAAAVSLFDWSADGYGGAIFVVRVEATANKIKLLVYPTGDRTKPPVLLDEGVAAPVRFDGIKSVSNVTKTDTGFTPNLTGAYFTVGPQAQLGIVQGNTDVNGLVTVTSVVVPGTGYIEGGSYSLNLLNTTDGTIGDALGQCDTSLIDYDNTTDLGVNFVDSKATNGFRFFFTFANKEAEVNDGGLSQITDVQLKDSSAAANTSNTSYFELFPQYEADFGSMCGYGQPKYVAAPGKSVTSDKDPIPLQQATTHNTLVINVDNLPLKSYIGKGTKANALLGDKPVGSLQGLTKMIGQVPRHLNDNGDGSAANAGPFSYTYFPYSVPMRNATELVMNEIDITIRNTDGTLATDVIDTSILLNISGVEGAGEASGQGVIGKPLPAPMSYDRLNITKGQLEPSVRGGFAQKEGAMNETSARHDDADSFDQLNPMAHL